MDRSDPDLMMAGASIAAEAFEADLLALTFETFSLVSAGPRALHPITGRPIAKGDLKDLAENHQGRERGLVTDALMVMAGNRAGDIAVRFIPYRVHKRDVLWLSPPAANTGRFEGRLTDMLATIMAGPTFTQTLVTRAMPTGTDFGLTPERAQAHQDCAAAKFLADPPGLHGTFLTALVAEPGSVREQVILESMPNAEVIRPIRGWQN